MSTRSYWEVPDPEVMPRTPASGWRVESGLLRAVDRIS